jgi:hypothetical protein
MTSGATGRRPDRVGRGDVAVALAVLAGTLLTLVAVVQLVEGVTILASGGDLLEQTGDALGISATAQGWIHVVIGLLGLVIGVAMVTEHTVGYLAGTAIAFLGAVTNFFLLPYQPGWALVGLALNVLVIWALCRLIGADRVDAGHYGAQ